MNLAIIIARKNSKRLKNKNLLKIGKHSLIQLSLIEALKVRRFHRIIINTDIKNIKNHFKFLKKKNFRKLIFIKRKPRLSGDKAKAVSVVLDSIKKLNNPKLSTVTLLLPTCPLRKANDINSGLDALKKNISTVISISKADFPPQFYFNKSSNQLLKPVYKNSPLLKNETRMQKIPESYRPNGAFYISWIKKIKKNKNLFKGKIAGVVMPSKRSIDIDTYEDLKLARAIFKNKI
tara:strand:+ start:147 stop:848 length:702 start_codon:yes stop_codon:yes gene_type:complete